MDKECCLSRREAMLALGCGLVATGLALFVRDPDTQRVIDALNGESASCFKDNIYEYERFRFDAIAVPGGGMIKNKAGIFEPSEFQKIRLEAAAIAYIERRAPIIILLDGKLEYSDHSNINRTYLQNMVKNLSHDEINLPIDSVIIENQSVNTAGNMDQLKKIAKRDHSLNILLITNFFHSSRAEIHACFNGINALSMPAEDIITSRFPGRKSELDLFYQSQPLDKIEKRERIAIAFSLFDPTGYIQTMAKELGFSP